MGHDGERRDVGRGDAYDPEADAWSELPPLPVGLVAPSVGLVGERVILVGGSVHMGAFPQDDTYALALRDLLGE